MAKKMLLVPEMEFQRLRKCDENVSSNILEEVKRPNEGALVKTIRAWNVSYKIL